MPISSLSIYSPGSIGLGISGPSTSSICLILLFCLCVSVIYNSAYDVLIAIDRWVFCFLTSLRGVCMEFAWNIKTSCGLCILQGGIPLQ